MTEWDELFAQDWDRAFELELSCDGTHKWDFPVRMGQLCMCGKKRWENQPGTDLC